MGRKNKNINKKQQQKKKKQPKMKTRKINQKSKVITAPLTEINNELESKFETPEDTGENQELTPKQDRKPFSFKESMEDWLKTTNNPDLKKLLPDFIKEIAK